MMFCSVVSHIALLAIAQKPQPSITFAFRHVEETHAKTINKIMTFTFFPRLSVPVILQHVILWEPKQLS
jgi:hypothetical protein